MQDDNGIPIVGFCLWCGIDFYTPEEADAHHSNESRACLAFQEFKNQCPTPPVLREMFEAAGLLEEDDGPTHDSPKSH